MFSVAARSTFFFGGISINGEMIVIDLMLALPVIGINSRIDIR